MLKLPNTGGMNSPMPDAPMDAQPMGDSSFMGAGMEGESNMNAMPPMDNGGMPPMDTQNQFDTNFDAGVEADEESDPKRYIQQLTGKLSQSLRSYTEGLPQPDADLNKYVAGMIVKQCVEGLSPEDKKEIMDKVNSGDDMEQMPTDNGDGMDMPNGDMQMPDAQMGGEMPQQPMNENMNARIDNLFNRFTSNDESNTMDDKNIKQKTYSNSPYRGKTFKN